MEEIFLQKGFNKKYPTKIYVWRFNKFDKVPEWISDRAKIESIGEDGNIKLSVVETSRGGIEIISSNGNGCLVKLENKDEDYICFSVEEEKDVIIHGVFPLTNHQLELMYKKLPAEKT